jgi:hypothetical protein
LLYVVDASTLITAQNTYYALERVPEFWSWLRFHGEAGNVKIPSEVYGEVTDGRDELAEWAKDADVRADLVLNEPADLALVRQVTALYGNDLTDAELEAIGQDPFLIAAALRDPANRCVVSSEVSAPAKLRQNRKVPDVCKDCGVTCIKSIDLLRVLDFRTDWNARRVPQARP